jgi:hypothetical protein
VAADTFTPYSTVAPYLGAPPAWLRPEDAQRIQSYQVYEEIYWNADSAYVVVGREGEEIPPIYVPNGRTIVDTTNRYVGAGFDFMVTPGTDPTLYGSEEQQAAARTTFTNLFRREKFKSKYAANKRFGLIRGDWLWHIVADPEKPEGSRISIYSVDPGSWFPVFSEENLDQVVRVYLVDLFKNEADEDRVKRLSYYKNPDNPLDPLIYMSEEIYEVDGWWKTDARPEKVITPPTALPADITAFPVYAIKNFEEPANPYGSSELRGLERIIQAVSQAVSDEDLALAMEGLGVYASDGPGPVDDDGNDIPWNLAPGSVAENASGLKRISGVGSVTPYNDHIGQMITFLREAAATPDAAIGKVDVSVAESGIALAMQLGPMLAKAGEKDQEILDVHGQMFYDLKFWFKVYEGIDFTPCEILPILGDKLPINIKGEIENAAAMIGAGLWSIQTAREQLAKKGIVFAADEEARVTSEAQAAAATQTSEIDGRINTELTTLGGASGG